MNEGKKHMHPLLVAALDGIMLGAFLLGFALWHHVGPIWYSQYQATVRVPQETASPISETEQQLETTIATELMPTSPEYPLPEETIPDETVPAETEPDLRTPWQIRFAEKFTQEVIQTENSYSSPNISVTIETVRTGEGSELVTYYVADIYVASLDCFRTYVADDDITFYSTQWAQEMDVDSGAVIGLSGDYYAIQKNSFTMRNGYLYSDGNPNCDVCVLYKDGTMVTYNQKKYNKKDILAGDPVQIWNFGPALLDENGIALDKFSVNDSIKGKHPRSAIGYYEPGHYCFLLADGRIKDHSIGMRIEMMAEIFQDLGCKAAYNLDGGSSAVMTFRDENYSVPSKERPISDMIIVVEPEGNT